MSAEKDTLVFDSDWDRNGICLFLKKNAGQKSRQAAGSYVTMVCLHVMGNLK